MKGPNYTEQHPDFLQKAEIRKSLSELEILTLKDTLIYLNVSASFLYKKTSAKEIPHFKPAGKLYFKRQDLDDFILQSKVKSRIDIDNAASTYLTSNKKNK